MVRWFNIGGPCNPSDNYTLSAMERLPEVAVVDADFSKPWEGKVSAEDLVQDGKAVHVVCC